MFRQPVQILMIALAVACAAGAAEPPLGCTLHDGGATFRVWAPYVDSAAVRLNDDPPVPMTKDPAHADPADTVWQADVLGAKAGDHYKYFITCNGDSHEFIDPRGLQLIGSGPGAASVVVDLQSRKPKPFTPPALNDLVIYELHVGSFHADDNNPGRYDFAGAAQQLDYLQKLGVNAIELLPINENAFGRRSSASDYDWGYDPSSYFAFKIAYGTPAQFLDFVDACHAHGIAVIVDVVYNHMASRNLLRNFGGYSSTQYPSGVYFNDAAHGASPWGPRPDFSRPQVAAMLHDNALMYLQTFGCDGERWDSVSNLRLFNEHDSKTVNPAGVALMRQTIADDRATHPAHFFIAEDLKNQPTVTAPAAQGGLTFDTQWDDTTCWDVRRAISGDDASRPLNPLAAAVARKIGDNPFSRVIYTENHDKAGHPPKEVRIPALVDPHDPQSIKAKRLSTLAAGIILTSPGVPMLFQGQEMLDPRTFTFGVNVPVEWNRLTTQASTIQAYRDLISVRHNRAGNTAGLQGPHVQVYHVDDTTRTLAYHRWMHGGPGDDVIIIANFSATPVPKLTLGFPHPGLWKVRFDSSSSAYDPAFHDVPHETTATATPADNQPATATLAIGPYSLLILSQDGHP
jgi:1,4-alpha-glucan branching enzyme